MGLGGPPTPYEAGPEPADPHSVSRRPAYQTLRRSHRRFGVRATAVAVGGFLLYVLLSSFAPGLMNTPLSGHLTLGLALGLGQFVLMGVVVWCYLVHMRTQVTPVVRGLRGLVRHQETAARERAAFEARTASREQEFRSW
ncbi:DUF485 domain-containing protein [Streptomyces sp. SID5470]|uniref:Integral membrane protein n=2 Tax=Streptomyces TaxID=1883 RepID=B5I7N3_STRX2|nr:DUF485 domain-containing protein [Streptomyces sp. SID5470]EDY61088.1 conserved hypothetical protein [Streptomyces sviceus ATCC 29083]MYT03563.1 DUF485 domain-containing protein [Streptomyces sp. SID5470]